MTCKGINNMFLNHLNVFIFTKVIKQRLFLRQYDIFKSTIYAI